MRHGVPSSHRDLDATRQMGMFLRDGSELHSLSLHPIPACEHDEQHALKAHASIINAVSSTCCLLEVFTVWRRCYDCQVSVCLLIHSTYRVSVTEQDWALSMQSRLHVKLTWGLLLNKRAWAGQAGRESHALMTSCMLKVCACCRALARWHALPVEGKA